MSDEDGHVTWMQTETIKSSAPDWVFWALGIACLALLFSPLVFA
ncbi:MAG: hypothetical protein ACXVXJ_04675 [Mycobacteriaceae bacterium]